MGPNSALRRSLVYAAMAICGLTSINASAQHVHGTIELGIVIEDNTVAVSLSAPLSDVVGFEHEPNTEAQKAAVERAAAVLADASKMFALSDRAKCKVTDMSMEGPDYITGHSKDGEHGDHHDDADAHDDHDDGHEDDSHGHEHRESAGHDHHDDGDHHDDHGDHDEHDEEVHAEVNASYQWTCDDVARLETLGLLFKDSFVSVENIEVQILSDAGARVVSVGEGTNSVSIAP